MRYRKLDENGDYMLGGRDHFLNNRAAVGQAIKTRLLLLWGEWREDPEDGLPLFEQVLGAFQGEDAEDIELIFSERILGTEDVTEITSMESILDPVRRIYTIACTVNTVYGTVDVRIGGDDLISIDIGMEGRHVL